MARRSHFILVAMIVLLVSGCTNATTKGWATSLETPPNGLTLDPPPPADAYWMAIISANIPLRNAGGQLWDDVGSYPDTVAELRVDGRTVMTTEAANDTLTPQWSSPRGNVIVDDGATLEIAVFESDALQNRVIGSAKLGPPSPTDLSDGKMVFDIGRQGRVVVRVEPAHGLLGLGFDYEIVSRRAFVKAVLKHSPAARAGVKVGDEILKIGTRSLTDVASREIRSAINAVGTTPVNVTLRHSAGTTEAVPLALGPVYPLYDEHGDLD